MLCCVICTEPMAEDQSPNAYSKVSLACGHSYHLECIKRWITSASATCPLCRATQVTYPDLVFVSGVPQIITIAMDLEVAPVFEYDTDEDDDSDDNDMRATNERVEELIAALEDTDTRISALMDYFVAGYDMMLALRQSTHNIHGALSAVFEQGNIDHQTFLLIKCQFWKADTRLTMSSITSLVVEDFTAYTTSVGLTHTVCCIHMSGKVMIPIKVGWT